MPKYQQTIEERFFVEGPGKLLDNIAAQCARRGIPDDEIKSVVGGLAKKHGKPFAEMNAGELRRVSQNLVDFLEAEYIPTAAEKKAGLRVKRRGSATRAPAGLEEWAAKQG